MTQIDKRQKFKVCLILLEIDSNISEIKKETCIIVFRS